jgi:hypothetical protein
MGLVKMKRDLLTHNIILVLSLVFITLNLGCSGKLKDAEEHYDLMMQSKNIRGQ